MNRNFVSVILPCRNECVFIVNIIENLLNQDYPKELLEIIIIDGLSDDGTQEIIEKFQERNSNLIYLVNPKKIVPFALNQGIEASRGEIIIRMDAHSIYPDNYISKLVYYLNELNADNVGGSWITKPGNDSKKACAISLATSSNFGVGNALYRTGSTKIQEVDTVPFGCYNREVFEKIGMFDEELIRNQDDEFNARLKKNGGRIYLIPSIEIIYFARENFTKMSKMFYQYGFFKPLVNRKIKSFATLRQFVPLFFVLYLFLLLMVSFTSINYKLIIFIGLFLYVFMNLLISVIYSFKNKKLSLIYFLFISFGLTHISYGLGYFFGIVRFILLKNMKFKREFNINR